MNNLQQHTQTAPAHLLIEQHVPLHDKNWFRTGGSAKFYCRPANAEQFRQAIIFACENKLEIFILGHGANILISDEGFDGLVIHPNMQSISLQDAGTYGLVTAGSGVAFPDLINWCLEHNLQGLEEFSGIPGTVGGSVFINIHYFEFLLSQFLETAQVINKTTGEILSVDNAWFNFGYNQSTLHDHTYFLVEATFKLKQVTDIEAAYHKGRSHEIIRHRAQRYPRSHTCGSFFRNFLEHEVTLESNGKKLIYVAYYLDKIGVKGHLSVGDAIVSYQHANMLVNRGNATTSDIIELARQMQTLVFEKYGILPQPECRLIGFKAYPFLRANHPDQQA